MDNNSLPPSGRWRGYYLYVRGGRLHGQSMHLGFQNDRIDGTGCDDIGSFQILGTYFFESRVATWTKRYQTHGVQYRGYFEKGRIWGIWTIKQSRGGFEIWPSQLGNKEQAELDRAILEAFETKAKERDLTMQQLMNHVMRKDEDKHQ